MRFLSNLQGLLGFDGNSGRKGAKVKLVDSL